jgi:hypothetical protein
MELIFWTAAAALIGAVVWTIAKKTEEARHLSRIRELESRFRLSQGEALNLKEQMATMKGEMAALQRNLEEERVSKSAVINEMALSFRKGALMLTAVYFAVGISLGSVSSWFAATWRAEAKMIRANAVETVDYELFKIRAELYEKRATENELELKRVREEAREERIQKVIALTKMQVLLESLSPKRGEEGFSIDYQKLKKNIRNEMKAEPIGVSMGVAEIRSRV